MKSSQGRSAMVSENERGSDADNNQAYDVRESREPSGDVGVDHSHDIMARCARCA